MKAQVCKASAALIAALALSLAAPARADDAKSPDASCLASDADGIAAKLGFPANPGVQSPEEGSCAITFGSRSEERRVGKECQ